MERMTRKTVMGKWIVIGSNQKAIDRLAAYEDTGLEPEQILELKSFTQGGIHKADEGWMHVQDLLQAEKDGRLVVLPCKVNDKLYVVGEKRIIRCDICEAYLDDKKGPEYLVSFDCDSDCNGCPFNSWHQDYSGEYSCDGEWGRALINGADIGKTVFLTRAEAEEALAQKGGKDHA